MFKGASIKAMTTETTKLLSEPTNEEAAISTEGAEQQVDSLREAVEAAQELKGYEKCRTKIRKKIDVVMGQWRRRKRVCMDFLIAMEENTDGTISMKKCMSGDGQIYIGEFIILSLVVEYDEKFSSILHSQRDLIHQFSTS